MGQRVSTAYQEHVVFSLFFNHYIELCFLRCIGQDTQAVCMVCVTHLHTVFWSAGVIFVSPFCQVYSDFLAFDLVSNGNNFFFFVPCHSSTRDKMYCSCKK